MSKFFTVHNHDATLSRTHRAVHKSLISACLLAALYLPFGLQTGVVALPFFPAPNQQSATSAAQKAAAVKAQHGETAWQYNFTDKPDGPLSHRYWNFETGAVASSYNGEQQMYTARTSNLRIEDGALVIEARPEAYGGKNYTSARVNTKGIFDFTYGTFEADMKLPSGVGAWPAAWLLPATNKYRPSDYGIANSDPYVWALNGEIDVAEAVGYIPGQNIPAIHTYNEVQRPATYTPAYITDSATAFHRYGVVKTPDTITFTIDSIPYATRLKTGTSALDWPFDQPYYVILNLAVGGTWAGVQGIDDASAPWQLHVRSVSYKPL